MEKFVRRLKRANRAFAALWTTNKTFLRHRIGKTYSDLKTQLFSGVREVLKTVLVAQGASLHALMDHNRSDCMDLLRNHKSLAIFDFEALHFDALFEQLVLTRKMQFDKKPIPGWVHETTTNPKESGPIATDEDFGFTDCPGDCSSDDPERTTPLPVFPVKVKQEKDFDDESILDYFVQTEENKQHVVDDYKLRCGFCSGCSASTSRGQSLPPCVNKHKPTQSALPSPQSASAGSSLAAPVKSVITTTATVTPPKPATPATATVTPPKPTTSTTAARPQEFIPEDPVDYLDLEIDKEMPSTMPSSYWKSSADHAYRPPTNEAATGEQGGFVLICFVLSFI